jgi:FMN reductase
MSATSPLIVGLGGSMRQKSRSLSSLRTVATFAEAKGIRTDVLDVRALALPMYHPDLAIEDYPAQDQPSIHRLLTSFREADAFVWSTPCYHGTISGVFKNAIDFLEYLQDDVPPYLQGRPVGLIAINEQITFTAMTQCVYGLRGWLAPTQVLLTSEHFDTKFQIINQRVLTRLERLVGELITFVSRTA